MACCEQSCTPVPKPDSRFRKALWIALVLNALMFGVELTGGISADSKSLLADAVDFLGDAANYAISLSVLALGALWRARAALIKGVSMGLYGVGILATVAYGVSQGNVPEPVTMGVIGALALATNVGVAVLLYAFREGDANMRSVWLCSRNDAIGNVAVMAAASGVFFSGSAWPDLLVATGMAVLALSGAMQVIRQARQELGAEVSA
jgi:Co/Zn/Cd efflux system component